MAEIINFSINLAKIPEDKIVTKDKDGKPFKNGGRYVNLTGFLNDNENEFGNDISIILRQSKEEREASEVRKFVGEGNRVKK